MQKRFAENIPDGVCPLVFSPSEDCHCVRMNSLKIGDVMRFCMGKYLECKIYRKLVQMPSESMPQGHPRGGDFEYHDPNES